MQQLRTQKHKSSPGCGGTVCNASTQEVEVDGSGIRGQIGLYNETVTKWKARRKGTERERVRKKILRPHQQHNQELKMDRV